MFQVFLATEIYEKQTEHVLFHAAGYSSLHR